MSRIEVPMPQMGESIAEGTVSKWLKEVGDAVERDEPILEISTDKVDAEIPSPSAGALTEILVAEGETVEVGTVVAYIDPNGMGGAEAAPPVHSEPEPPAEKTAAAPSPPPPHPRPRRRRLHRHQRGAAPHPVDPRRSADRRGSRRGHLARDRNRPPGTRDQAGHPGIHRERPGRGRRAGADSHRGPGHPHPHSRRGSAPTGTHSTPTPAHPRPRPPTPSGDDLWRRFAREVDHPAFPVREEDRVETMDKVRRLTAEHMVLSKRIHSHVHSIIEIDFTAVDRIRRENKARWARRGARVSYTAFVAWACSRILRDFPSVNGVLSGNNIIYRGAVNLGMAVDLNPGLIVPVIHDADDLSLVGTARKIIDLATRAKDRQLSPSEIQGATFTITNPGVLGTMVGMPIIPKGTSAILGTGSIEKRVVVLTDPGSGQDSMAIRKRSFFSLGYDHRLVDGADSARFLSALKELLEDFPEDA